MDFTTIVIAVCAALVIFLVAVYLLFGREQAPFTFDIGGAGPRASGGADNSVEKSVSDRIVGLGIAVGAVFATLIARLWSMQLVSSDEYARLAERNRTRTISVTAPRGRILDRNGAELVTNRSSLTVVASPDVVQDEVEVQLLANLLGMPELAVRRKIRDSSSGAQSMRSVAVDVSRRTVAFIGAHPEAFPGVDVEQRTQRKYPNGSLAAHVLGYTGTVTEEQLTAAQEAEEGSASYKSGDIVGQAGVEYQYESVLQGIHGEQTVYVDAGGNVLSYEVSVEPKSGSDVMLTIDTKIQAAAERSLAEICAGRGSGKVAEGGSCICLDATNGEILALASYPTFEPSVFVGGISNSDWESLQSEDAHFPLLDRAVAGQYPPGSTIKPFTALAGLEYNIADEESSWYCTGWWTGFGDAYGQACWKREGHGYVDMRTGIINSCDIVFYELGKGFFFSDNQEGMQDVLRRFGYGAATGIDLPGEMVGRVPDAEWKWNYFSDSPDEARRWQGGDSSNIAIGQGDMLVTLLQVAQGYTALARRGAAWRPHVLRSVLDANGEALMEYRPENTIDPAANDKHRDLVSSGLRGVIYEEDYTQTLHWTSLSQTVEGKTGTAEQYNKDPMGWFACYVPADDPKYVVVANVDVTTWGSESAMLVCRDILGAIYDEPDTIA